MEMGELFGGPFDGTKFIMSGFWLAVPDDPKNPLVAPEVFIDFQFERPIPVWRNYQVLAPDFFGERQSPVSVYSLVSEDPYRYRYKGDE